MYHFVINLSLLNLNSTFIYMSLRLLPFPIFSYQIYENECLNYKPFKLLTQGVVIKVRPCYSLFPIFIAAWSNVISDLWTANPQTSSNWSCLHLPLSRYNRNNVTKYFIPWNPTKLLTLTKTKIIPTGRIVSTSIYKIAEPRKYHWHV